MKLSEEEILFDQPLQILNICRSQENIRELVIFILGRYIRTIGRISSEDMKSLFGHFFNKADIKFSDKIVNGTDDIISYFKNNALPDQVVFIDYSNIGDMGPNERVDTFVDLYKQLRNECLSSSYIIFYYVDPEVVVEFNNKLMNFSDIDMPGYDLVYPGPSTEMAKITIARAFYRSWGWSQIEKLGTRKLEKTIAFYDLEGYTVLFNENIEKQLRMAGQLNLFHEKVINIIYDNRGYVNDTTGDGIMAVFDRETQVGNAIEATFEILKILENMKSDIHIGIETGVVIEGTMGTTRFNKLTQIGEVVNTASRICSPKEDDDIKLEVNNVHIGEETYERLKKIHTQYLDEKYYLISERVDILCGQKSVKVYTISKK